MRTRLKLWLIATGALLALLWRFFGEKANWQEEAVAARERLAEALQGKADEARKRKEAEADADLEAKRSKPAADRLRGALDRARRRRTGAGR